MRALVHGLRKTADEQVAVLFEKARNAVCHPAGVVIQSAKRIVWLIFFLGERPNERPGQVKKGKMVKSRLIIIITLLVFFLPEGIHSCRIAGFRRQAPRHFNLDIVLKYLADSV